MIKLFKRMFKCKSYGELRERKDMNKYYHGVSVDCTYDG